MRYADAPWRTAYTGASSARRGRAAPVVLAVALALLPVRGQARGLAPLVPGTPTALSGKVVRMSQKPAVTFVTDDRRLIGRLVRDINALPPLRTPLCAADRGPHYYLLFTYTHRASRLVTLDRSGCVGVGVAHLPGRTAVNNPQVFKDLESIVLADMRPPPPASAAIIS